jgi:hypothetical protein
LTPNRLGRLALALSLLLALAPAVAGEELWSASGFFIDLPAGFSLVDGDGASRFAFADPNEGMEFDIRVYERGRYSSAEAMAKELLGKLSSTGETESFTYEGRQAVMAQLSFSLNGEKLLGFGLFILGRGKPAEPSYVLLGYTDGSSLESYADLIFSCLDAFSADGAARRAPGPVSQYLLAWPPEATGTKTVLVPGGDRVALPWNAEESRTETDTAGREYRVLSAYADNAELWVEAWARFYRMVYRESAARLDRLGLELARRLPQDDPTEVARRVLAWAQGFVYERDPEGIDFVAPLTSAYEGRGDCDARAVVAAALLERMGIDAILMLSREYSHAMVAVDVPGGGQRFPFGGKKYLVGETTSKVGLGMIAASQADFSKWLGVDLGN